MDPLKIIVFLAVFGLLLLLGRLLSSSSEVHAAELPHPSPQPGGAPQIAEESGDSEGRPQPVLTGAEIDFPVPLPPVRLLEDGRFNRPNILNYHFAKTDLLRGPADSSCFYDELFIQAQDPQSEHVWTYAYTVATPAGLRQFMEEQKFDSLYFDRAVIIVPRWDLAMILHTVTEEIMKSYGQKEVKDEDEAAKEPDD